LSILSVAGIEEHEESNNPECDTPVKTEDKKHRLCKPKIMYLSKRLVYVKSNFHWRLHRMMSTASKATLAAKPRPLRQKKKRTINCQLLSWTAKFDTRISCIMTSHGKFLIISVEELD
jgi:hypothetical protein